MTVSSEKHETVTHRCPLCDAAVSSESLPPRGDNACSDCGYPLWCHKTTVGDVVLLGVIPHRTPKYTDVLCLARSLERAGNCPCLVVDLSRVDGIVDSTFVARLVALNKRVCAGKGRLILCNLRPLVRDVIIRTKLDTVFEICEDRETALARAQSISTSSSSNVRSSPASG
jgi:anti-anti-sigma regulatory factor